MNNFDVLRISCVSDDPSTESADWVNLEQNKPTALSQFASIRDVYKLWMAAVSGKSAQMLRAINCPVEFVGSELHVYIGFYAWPSRPTLNYSLNSSIGVIGERQSIKKQREFSVFVNNTNRVDLPYYMESVSWEWESPAFIEGDSPVPFPDITNHNTWLELSTSVFAALRVKGKAVGVYCVCDMVLDKGVEEEPVTQEELNEQRERDEAASLFLSYKPPKVKLTGYKISNLENTITASWVSNEGELQTDELRLDIPQCVKDVLNFCPDMYQTILLWCKKVATRQVYFGTCEEDDLLAVIDGVDERSYCSRTQVKDGFDPSTLLP